MNGPQHENKSGGTGADGISMEPFQGVIRDTRKAWLKVRLFEAFLRCAILLFAVMLIGFGLDNIFFLPSWFRLCYMGLAGILAAALLIRGLRKGFSLSEVGAAILLDRKNPELDNRLVNAFLLANHPVASKSAFLSSILKEAGSRLRALSLRNPVSLARVKKLLAACGVGAILLIAYGALLPHQFVNAALRFTKPGAGIPSLSRFVLEVSPGDVRLPAGSSLVIEAFPQKEIPSSASLTLEGGQGAETLPMDYAGGIYIRQVYCVDEDFTYSVSAGDFESPTYRVKVLKAPRPELIKIHYAFPSYSGLPPETVEGTSGDIEALKGTRATLEVYPDRPASSAWLQFEGGQSLEMIERPGSLFVVSLNIEKDATYTLMLRDGEGLVDPDRPSYSITALEDGPPAVEIAAPGKDIGLPAGINLPVMIEARDDVGLKEVNLVFWIGEEDGTAPETLAGAWTFEPGAKKARAAGLLHLEDAPGDAFTVIGYKARAQDRAGNIRESASYKVTVVPEIEEEAALAQAMKDGVLPMDEKPLLSEESPEAEGIRKAVETLEKFAEAQRAIVKASLELLDETPEDFTPLEEEAIANLKQTEEEWGKILKSLSDDYHKLQPQDFSDASMSDEFVEMFSEVELAADALDRKAVEIAVPHESAGLELAETITANLERWLADVADNKKWSMEDPTEDYEVPLADLPAELEDIVGDLIDSEETMTQEVEDLTSGWMDSLNEGAGWTVSDGPISNMSAKGITGNLLPNTQEVGGRSGEGRSGKSSGQMVEKTADGKGGRQTPTRLTPDAYEGGKVDDRSQDPEGGSTGGGKLSGSGPEGLRGPEPPEVRDRMDRLAGKQAEIRQDGERLKLELLKRGYYPEDLDRALEIMRSMEASLKNHARKNYGAGQRLIINRLERLKTVVAASIRFDREQGANLPESLRAALRSAFGEPAPEEYRELISRYYQSLAEPGEKK